MRWFCLLLAALLITPSAVTAADTASATAAAVAPPTSTAAEAAPAPAAASSWQHPTVENAVARVELSTYRAAVVRMSLLGTHVLVLPKWRADALTPGNQDQVRTDPQSVIDGYNTQFDMNNFIAGLGLPDDPGLDGTWSWMPDANSKQAGTMRLERSGLVYLVRYAMDDARPEVHVRVRVENHGAAAAQMRLNLRALDGIHVDDPVGEGPFLRYVSHVNGVDGTMSTGSFPADGVTTALAAGGTLDYFALKSRFFAAWWTPGGVSLLENGKATQLNYTLAAAVHGYRVDTAQMQARNPIMQAMLEIQMPAADQPAWSVPAGATFETSWSLAVACMDKNQLAALKPVERELEYTDGYYRFFKSLANIMTWALRMIAHVVRVYALAVIILTCLIKLAMHRFTAKQYASMFKIQKLQPELKYLQQQYKSDRQALQIKTMELYKKHDVSIFGGCLPMLIQIPVFTGLYQSFYHAADLRGQSFLWISTTSPFPTRSPATRTSRCR